jgi:hypothetical protein
MFSRTIKLSRLVLLVVLLTLVACGASEPAGTPVAAVDTNTPVPPTATPVPPTDTAVPPTDTPVPPTETPVPPTSTPTPEPPTATPSPTEKPTEEPQILATSAEEIVGEYMAPRVTFLGGDFTGLVMSLGDDGSLGWDTLDLAGKRDATGVSGTWWFEDGQMRIQWDGECAVDATLKVEEGVVSAYELLGGDRPARLTFRPKGDRCMIWRIQMTTAGPWDRYEE